MPKPAGFVPILLVWLLIGLLCATFVYLGERAAAANWSWAGIVRVVLPLWLVWAAVTPVLFALARRYPLGPGNWLSGMLIHLPLSVLWLAAYMALAVGLELERTGLPLAEFLPLARRHIDLYYFSDYLLYWIVLAVGAGVEYHNRFRAQQSAAAQLSLKNARLQSEVAAARLLALEARLHPHFLFNTLNTISGLVRRGDSVAAQRMIQGLGAMLRRALQQDAPAFVSLREEMTYLKDFLSIEQVRLGDRLEVEIRVDPQVEEFPLPRLILQPVVENAILHGAGRLPGRVRLRIAASARNGDVEVEVVNDGPLLPSGWNLEGDSGLGLSNVVQRLRSGYGMRAKLELANAGENGVRALLSFPVSVGTSGGRA